MITDIRLVNFLSFEDETFYLNEKQNVLVGINGSGKSNLLKALRLVKEGVSGIGLRKYVIDSLGGLDNILFKSSDKSNKFGLYFNLDCNAIKKYGFKFTENVIYSIEIFKVPSTSNYYVKEKIQNKKGFIYLDFDNGNGVLNELDKSETYYKKTALVKYDDFIEPTELALSKIYDTDRYFALSTHFK